MSKQWWIVFGVALGLSCVAIIVGLSLSGVSSFMENLLPGAAVSLIVFAVAVRLIEGSIKTRESRLQKVVSRASRDVARLNEEITITLVREIGEDLASRLDSNVDLSGKEREDWTAFKGLLQKIFEDARQVSVRGLPKSGPISKEVYLSYVDAARRFMERVGSAIGTSFEVQAQLLELIEHRDRLSDRIVEASYPDSIRNEKERYVRLGAIGDSIIDLIDG